MQCALYVYITDTLSGCWVLALFACGDWVPPTHSLSQRGEGRVCSWCFLSGVTLLQRLPDHMGKALSGTNAGVSWPLLGGFQMSPVLWPDRESLEWGLGDSPLQFKFLLGASAHQAGRAKQSPRRAVSGLVGRECPILEVWEKRKIFPWETESPAIFSEGLAYGNL